MYHTFTPPKTIENVSYCTVCFEFTFAEAICMYKCESYMNLLCADISVFNCIHRFQTNVRLHNTAVDKLWYHAAVSVEPIKTNCGMVSSLGSISNTSGASSPQWQHLSDEVGYNIMCILLVKSMWLC